jgi:hypothetical protein
VRWVVPIGVGTLGLIVCLNGFFLHPDYGLDPRDVQWIELPESYRH